MFFLTLFTFVFGFSNKTLKYLRKTKKNSKIPISGEQLARNSVSSNTSRQNFTKLITHRNWLKFCEHYLDTYTDLPSKFQKITRPITMSNKLYKTADCLLASPSNFDGEQRAARLDRIL